MRPVIATTKELSSKNFVIRFLRSVCFSLRSSKWLVLPFALLALGGCSIRPLQEDVTQVSTKDIVNNIRCEARYAVLGKAIELLRDAARSKRAIAAQRPRLAGVYLHDADKLDDVADRLEPLRGCAFKFNPSTLPTPESVEFYNRYINTAIAYDFSLNITETNGVSATVDPIRLISGGMVNGGLTASNDLTRANVRTFRLSDNFKELLEDEELLCGPEHTPSNFMYPIAGSVSVRSVIYNFIDLYEVRPLEIPAGGGGSLADALEFTTDIKGAAKPLMQIAAVGNGTGFGSSTGPGLSAGRKDFHKVTIGLTIGSSGKVAFVTGTRGEVLPVRPRTGETRPAAENRVRAFKAIDDQRINNFLDRAGALLR